MYMYAYVQYSLRVKQLSTFPQVTEHSDQAPVSQCPREHLPIQGRLHMGLGRILPHRHSF
jgi:hypothetical protein